VACKRRTPENGIVYTFGGSNYVWNGVDLNELGAAPDLTPYSTTAEIDLKLDDKASVVTLQSITTAPVEAILDQYYYKLSVKSLYKYKLVGHTSDLSWQNVGAPKVGTMYVFNGANYVWNGVDLIEPSNIIESLSINGTAVPITSKNMAIVTDNSLDYSLEGEVLTFKLSQEYKDIIESAL